MIIILRLFQICLREIMKINAVPVLIIGGGLALILFTTGDTDTPRNEGSVGLVCV